MKQFIFLLVFLPQLTLAQECNCDEAFTWLKTTFEENDAGFQYIIDKKGESTYDLHNQIYTEKVKAIKSAGKCQSTLRKWLSFFRKAHVELHYTGKIESQGNDESEISKSPQPTEISNDPLHLRFLNSQVPFLERLNENTLYLRVPSFHGTQKHLIDSTILANQSEILSTENLIIDIRNGTGGSDDSFEEIMPFLYTNPIRLPTLEFLSTPLNNQRMLDFATNTGIAIDWGLNPTEEEMKEFQANYDTLSNHLGEFVNLRSSNVRITKLDTVYPYPKQVGILINQNNVSTDEEFLLEAKQSKKVKLYGTTTKGGLDVSNLYLTFSPKKEFVLVYALSKSLRIPDLAIDDIGIMPDFYLDDEIPEHEWINYVSNILNE